MGAAKEAGGAQEAGISHAGICGGAVG